MKLNKIFAAFMLIAAVAFTACQPQNPPGNLGPNNNGGDSTSTVVGVQGQGTLESPFTADDVITLSGSKTGTYYVKAYIVGQVAGKSLQDESEFAAPFSGGKNDDGTEKDYNTNILIASVAGVTDVAKCVPVQLSAGALRSGLNLKENPDMLGQEVLIYGSLEAYFSVPGIKNPSYAVVGDKKFGLDPEVEVTEPTATPATVAEFQAATVDPTVYYELTGTINNLSNTTYGNFDLTDETGSVSVWGLTAKFIPMSGDKAVNDKSFSSLGLKSGDKVTIRGTRSVYNDKIQVLGAYFVKLVEAGSGDNTGDNGNTGTTPEGAIVFDPNVDKGNASDDYNNPSAYEITKDGITLSVSEGVVTSGQYRIYKSQKLVVTSTAGNIKSIKFTCTKEGTVKEGPGCFEANGGTYTYEGKVGTWTGDASEVVFTASSNQVRATQIAVVVE